MAFRPRRFLRLSDFSFLSQSDLKPASARQSSRRKKGKAETWRRASGKCTCCCRRRRRRRSHSLRERRGGLKRRGGGALEDESRAVQAGAGFPTDGHPPEIDAFGPVHLAFSPQQANNWCPCRNCPFLGPLPGAHPTGAQQRALGRLTEFASTFQGSQPPPCPAWRRSAAKSPCAARLWPRERDPALPAGGGSGAEASESPPAPKVRAYLLRVT